MTAPSLAQALARTHVGLVASARAEGGRVKAALQAELERTRAVRQKAASTDAYAGLTLRLGQLQDALAPHR